TISPAFLLALSSKNVANLTGSDPSSLPYTVIFNALLFAPLIAWVLLSFYGAISVIYNLLILISNVLLEKITLFNFFHKLITGVKLKRRNKKTRNFIFRCT